MISSWTHLSCFSPKTRWKMVFSCEMQFLKHYTFALWWCMLQRLKEERHLLSRESLASVFSQEDFWIALCNANYHIFCKKVHFLNSSKHEKAFVRSLFKLSQWEESTVWTEGFFLCKVALPQLQISPSKIYFFKGQLIPWSNKKFPEPLCANCHHCRIFYTIKLMSFVNLLPR